MSLMNLDADWLEVAHPNSASWLLSESSQASGLNPAELRETASPRPPLSRPISACSASSSASSAYEDAAGSSAFEDADEYDEDEFHDVEQEYYAAARIQAVARGKSDRRDSPVLTRDSPVLTRDSPVRWRELGLWRELGDVLISINGAEPSVEELHAALQSHGGSFESLATYARTNRSALTEELKRLGFSKIDLRKKVEQVLAEIPKAPSLAGDLLGRPSGSPQPLSTGAIVVVGDGKQPAVAAPPLLITAEEEDWHASASSTSPQVQTTPTRFKPLSPAQSMGVSPLSRVRLIPKQSSVGVSVGASQIVASQIPTPDRYASQRAALERQITDLPNIPVTQSLVGASCSRPVPRRSSSYIVPPGEAVAPGAAAPSEAVAASAKWLQRAELMMPNSPTYTPSDAPETPYARLKRALSFERKKFTDTPAAPPEAEEEAEEEAAAEEEQQHLNKLNLKRSLSFERKQHAGTSAAPSEEAQADEVAAIKAKAEARAAAFIIAASEAAKAEAFTAEARPQQEAATKLQAIERGNAARAKAADMKAADMKEAATAAAAAAAAADEAAAAEAAAQARSKQDREGHRCQGQGC